MYNPNSLEEERASWRCVVYYNIVRALRRIFEVYDAYGEPDDEPESAYGTPESSAGPSNSQGSHSEQSLASSTIDKQMQLLKLRLSPLLDTESRLEARICGGSPVSLPDKGSLFVRSGWQARSMFKSRFQQRTSFTGQRSSLENGAPRTSEDSGMIMVGEKDTVLEETANILNASKEDVKELWAHPSVRKLREKRKLRLEEWAEL